MADRNGYFKVIDGSSSVSVKYFPPEDNGEKLDIYDVTSFLDKMGVKNYDLVKLNALISGYEVAEDVISNEGCYRFDEVIDIKVTTDRMYAIGRFYPPSENGLRMNKEEILQTIEDNKVVFGINMEAIDSFIENPEYCKNIVIATGTKPVEGADAFITYKFQTDRSAKPKLNDDGTVDFHHLNNISNIKKGDVLAVLTKEDVGVPGTDVLGIPVNPKKVKHLTLKHGNGISVTEDGLKLIALVDGHATLEKDRVFVSDNYDVPADVDNSTGDITYSGSVTVKGNVRTGFAVEADGDIEVFGVVEGCKLSSGGNIILHRGIQGMGKSDIKAKGNLISKFIEGADVSIGGYVETDTIINSNVAARGDIYVRGKNASLIGGNVSSTTLIEAANIGSSMGAATNVEVGTDPGIREKVRKLNADVEEKQKENEKMSQLLSVMRKKRDMGVLEEEKKPMLAQLTKNIILNDSEIKTKKAEIDSYEKLLEENVNARIRVTKSIYPGTKVTLAGDDMLIHKEIIHSEFKRIRNEIRVLPL